MEEKIFKNFVNPLAILCIKGGNYADYLQKSSFLYARLLGSQRKDLYLLGVDSDWSYAVGLTKKKRKSDKEGELLDSDDIKELIKIFPLCSNGVANNFSEIKEKYRIKSYTGEESEKHLTTSDLEKILEGKPVEVF
jgi:hypothetical protein